MLPIGVNLTVQYPFEDILPIIAEAGFDGVDVSFSRFWTSKEIRSDIIPETVESEDAFLGSVAPIGAAAKKNGLKVFQTHAPYPGWAKTEQTDAHLRDVLRWSVRATAELGAKYMIYHPVKSQPERAENWAKTMEVCESLIPAAKQYGVTICLENLFRARKAGDITKLVAATGADYETAARKIDELNAFAGEELFGFCLDTGHSLLAGLDVKDVIVTMGSRLKALHVHDNNGISDQHLMPYVGAVNWERFVDGLAQIDYRGVLSFETQDVWKLFDYDLMPSVEKLIAETGRMFARRIEERKI